MRWEAEFFSKGHSWESLEEMSYWTFLLIVTNLHEIREDEHVHYSGKTKYKNIKPSQKEMMKKRQAQREKEGISHGRRNTKNSL